MGRGLRVTIFNRDWDVCIDNPASLPIWMRDAARLLKGHVGQYVFISTISVYAANDKPADETAPLAAYKGRTRWPRQPSRGAPTGGSTDP